jgi:two-component system cell cycle sensor histidine kinase/response regulator CckA
MSNPPESKDDLSRELAETRERLRQLESAASMQQQAEAALREIEAHYERLLESVNSYVFRVELDQECPIRTTHGSGCTAITGYTPAEFEDNPNLWIAMVPEADRAMVTEQIDRLHSGQDVIPIEHRIRRKGGEVRWVQNTSVLRRYSAGQLLGYDGLIEDITERKRAQEALRNQEIIFPPFVENLYDLITIHDPSGVFSYVSPSVTRLLGHAPVTLIGRSLFEFIHPEDLSSAQAAFQKAVVRVTPTLPTEYRFRHADGSWVHLESVASNLQDHPGVNGIVVTTREVPASRRIARGSVCQDTEGKIVSANAVAGQILGLSLEEMMGCTSSDPHWRAVREDGSELPGDQHPAMVALRTGHPVRGVVMGVFNPSENAYRWIVVYSVPCFLPGETKPFQIYSSFIDITEQKRAQESLRISENRYRSLVSHMAEGVALHKVIYDEKGKAIDYEIVDVNSQYERILNLAQEKVTHKRSREVYGTLESPYLEEFSNVASSGRPHRFETYFAPMDRFFDISVVSWEKGQFATIFTDITESKRAEDVLRESERRFRELLENVNLVAIMLDPQGRITFCNDQLLKLTGWDRQEILGHNWFDVFVRGSEGDQIRARFLQSIQVSEMPAHYEYPIVTRYGGSRLIAWDNTVLREVDGAVVGMAGLGRDITEQRSLEEQLRQAQKMESVGRLAGGVAHDFNNLLTAINGYAELLLLEIKAADPLYSGILAIKKAGEQATALTRQLLAFSRKQLMQPKVLDLNVLIQENSNMLRRLIGEDVPLITHFDPELKHVKADPGQIEQVILNLAVNARDAMPSGGQLILETANVKLTEEYSWRHVSVHPGDYVMLSVTDTGSGMDAETLSHIFEPFFTTKGVGKGTGLGLSTVYGIIQQSGGHIGVHSELGQGTTFKIYLPMVEEPLEAAGSRTWLMETPRGVETVLVVEDEEMVRSLASLTLRMKGYKVLEAINGEEALRACEYDNAPIHLLLSDVVMPQMSGRELAQRLIQIRPTMKVLYMSGYTDNAVSHHGILDAGLEYIQKPFSPESLVRRVREVLDFPERGTIV